MDEQLSPESRRLIEMVERIMARTRSRLPETLAQLQSAEAAVKAAEEEEARVREDKAYAYARGMEFSRTELKQLTRDQLKTAWIQIKRSSRFGLLPYMGYLLARPDLGFLEIAFLVLLALGFLAAEYQERKEIMAETERAINQQASHTLGLIEEKHARLEQDLEDTILALAMVERKTRRLPVPS